MSNLSDFIGGGGKPKLITVITSGTGTHVPTADMARCLVMVQAGGSGGAATANAGAGGAMARRMLRVQIAGLAYSVGAGGAVATDGSRSTFGPLTAVPGRAGGSTNDTGVGGFLGSTIGVVSTTLGGNANGAEDGVSGGGAGDSTHPGRLAGFPGPSRSGTYTSGSGVDVSALYANTAGNGSGGNSYYGVGGATGAAPAAGNYGAGGGINAAGLGGCIEIWDYGV